MEEADQSKDVIWGAAAHLFEKKNIGAEDDENSSIPSQRDDDFATHLLQWWKEWC